MCKNYLKALEPDSNDNEYLKRQIVYSLCFVINIFPAMSEDEERSRDWLMSLKLGFYGYVKNEY